MSPTLNEKLIAYLALISGLAISAVAVYYSVVGLTAIFAAAAIPIIIMGTTLEIGKLVATVWLKQNWKIAPWSIKIYLMSAILVLMIVTSMGIFGFLSKAHSDQNLVSGDVLAKIAIYDEKIKTGRDNIDANRKALKQMDEAVDQIMGRSSDEKGADKAVQIRRGQQNERSRLLAEVEAEQKKISHIMEDRAPVAAEIRKVEAEVGPIKYIAAFFYGSTDPTILEKSVTWVIITLIIVFDPLAVMLLLASQISFANFRERSIEKYEADDGPLTTDQIYQIRESARENLPVGDLVTKEEVVEGDSPEKESDVVSTATVTEHTIDTIENSTPWPTDWEESTPTITFNELSQEDIDKLDKDGYIQNEEQKESNIWSTTLSSKEEYLETSAAGVNLDPYNDALHPEVADYISLIRSGKMSLRDVPVSHIMEVKARM